ncbi:SDR family NAD(P)-dependent oxidoreductase [Metabacillus fastidiosus]|uniref:SDR family NAD(P)-dependent oxidoreductase n=1 Tax=Metabacillus fastidiosus TaxID=1458 RepID=UPI002E1B1D28|nr:SDR family NAD(P)-dependent oxidoreductase [Metabacillus fastidiosus]
MRKALVLGASGGMGYSIVKELSGRGIKVVAFARTKEKLEKLFQDDSNVTIQTGDIFKETDLIQAVKGVDIVFQSANIPYSQWERKLALFMSNIIKACKIQSAKLAIVDNIYAYGRHPEVKIPEEAEKNPHTKKGKIRLEIENLVKNSDVEAVICHFPDFYGPNANNAILHFTLQDIMKGKKARFVGDQTIEREYIFTPDGAKAIVNLAMMEEAYGENWNIRGDGVITGKEIINMIRKYTNYEKNVSTVTKTMVKMIGIFNADMREVVEMFYLNEEPVVLSSEKYERKIGPLPCTPYEEGLRQTIEFMRRNSLDKVRNII